MPESEKFKFHVASFLVGQTIIKNGKNNLKGDPLEDGYLQDISGNQN